MTVLEREAARRHTMRRLRDERVARDRAWRYREARDLACLQMEQAAQASKGDPLPKPVLFHGHAVCNGRQLKAMAGGAFGSYDAIITALATAGRRQDLTFAKATITTAGNFWYSLWGAGGIPAAGVFGTALTSRTMLDSSTGGYTYTNATGGRQMQLLAPGVGSPNTTPPGLMVLHDRMQEYPLNGSVTAAQTHTQPGTYPTGFPARDQNGATAGTGVVLYVENDITGVASAAAGPTLTISYTNDAGTAGQSTGAIALSGAAPVGRLLVQNPWIPLAAGDFGVRSIQTTTLSATITTTKVTIVKARTLAYMPNFVAAGWTERDMIGQLAKMPIIWDDTAFAWLLCGNTTTSNFFANLTIAEG